MPAAAYRSGIWKGIAVAAIGLVCVAGGWWLGQLQNGAGSADQARLSLERQVSDLQQRLNLGEASAAEQQRLLELLIGLDRKAEATALLERLADQQPQRWPLRLLLAELRRDQKDLSGAEREVCANCSTCDQTRSRACNCWRCCRWKRAATPWPRRSWRRP